MIVENIRRPRLSFSPWSVWTIRGMSAADAEEVRKAQQAADDERRKQAPAKQAEADELRRQQREAEKNN